MNEQKQHLRSRSVTTTSVIFMQQKEKKSDVLKTKATGVCGYVLGCVCVYIYNYVTNLFLGSACKKGLEAIILL